MVRMICVQNDYADAANIGGPNVITYKTFDVNLPEVEAWLKSAGKWESRSFQGLEVVEAARAQDAGREP